jgi:predicted house-cleaning noncanonical NTP pyrophosphatase (MazG superfamily)
MKLVRDNIPKIIERDGKLCTWRHCNGRDEHMVFLGMKMSEEVQEFLQDPSIEEASDMYEVLIAIIQLYGYDLDTVMKYAGKKRFERGGFSQGVILKAVNDEKS